MAEPRTQQAVPTQATPSTGRRSFAPEDLHGDLYNWIADIAGDCTPTDERGNLMRILVLLETSDENSRELILEAATDYLYLHTPHFRNSKAEYIREHCAALLPGLGTLD